MTVDQINRTSRKPMSIHREFHAYNDCSLFVMYHRCAGYDAKKHRWVWIEVTTVTQYRPDQLERFGAVGHKPHSSCHILKREQYGLRRKGLKS